ncbi:hypothetical protein QEN19_003169 [Hanseniaspora menglaensis]
MDLLPSKSSSPAATAVSSFDVTFAENNITMENDSTNINMKSQSPKPTKTKHAPVHYTDDDYLPSTRVNADRIRPEMDSSLSNDSILLDILNILYDNESGNELENGFTVKQICDELLEKDPKMIDLSTKFANLISAKINAYAKKVENRVRGDFNVNIKYWIIRKWAKGNSPKRMVYIYKGLLPEEYSEAPPPTPLTRPTGSNLTKNSALLKTTEEDIDSLQKKTLTQDNLKKDALNDINKKVNQTKILTNSNIGVAKTNLLATGNSKFSINLNRFQQFGYKMNHSSVNKQNGSQTINKLQKLNSVNAISNKISNDKKVTKPLISGSNKNVIDGSDPYNNGNEGLKNIDSVKISQQIQLIQKSIQQISPVQKISANNHRHQEQQSLLINRKWMETLKSGFMSEEILSPDNMKLSDFDTLFN